ncbi:cardiolipin synthase [Bacteroides sp. 214]|uniref:cardiolipin synthase n=1 Tax=Bacteroides sp. 214 TaxID=2302935 RepID=UPI0013D88FC7|nr:cardiolipin synthase [Bacteroides sp. 214]NDW13618.1 cardiolipin synthase [Bacteroides sp. 214]
MDTLQLIGIILRFVYLAAIVSTIVVIILDNRNPVKTMAWVLILMFLPFVGLVFYIFFGRSTRKERIIERKSYDRLLKKPMAAYQAQELSEVPYDYEGLIRFFWNTNQAFPFKGNDVTTYTEGYSMLQALMREIKKARHHIHLEFYIFKDDSVGRLLRDLLIDKAHEGVEVRLIYDDVGCWRVPNNFFEEMRDAGIEVRSFLKVRFPLFTSQVNFRNHRKIVVIDGKVGFIGGMNIAERYLKGFSWGTWRDTHIKLRGRAAHGLQTAFLLDWFFVDQTLITSSSYFPRIENGSDHNLTQIVTSDPVGPWKEIMQGITTAITNAKKYFYIQTPYFLPTDTLSIALQSAALSGVDVRIMIPERADTRITHWGSRSYLKDMMLAGVKIYFYQKGFLHSKLLVSDDMLSSVGSTNIDFRSFEHNFEVNAFIYNANTAKQLKELFLQDQKESQQILLKKWKKRPLYQKAIESIVRIIAPLL